MITRKAKRHSGANKPFDCSELKAPSSEIMVGRNSGMEANETLQQKKIKANIQSIDWSAL